MGAAAPVLADVRVVDLTPASATVESVMGALRAAKLNPADMRARVVLMVDAHEQFRDAAILTYAALVGFAQRRLDVLVGDADGGALGDIDTALRNLPDAGRPDPVPAVVQVGDLGRDDMLTVDLGAGVSSDGVSAIRFARRLRWVAPVDTLKALQQLVLIAALRARGAHERFPALVAGTEGADQHAGEPGVDLELMRRDAELMRRDLRSDNRDAIADPQEPSASHARWNAADLTPIAHVLTNLGARSKMVDIAERTHPHTGVLQPATVVEVWHCPRPDRHANGDATPSMRVHAKSGAVQCFRCDAERVGPLRLVMDVLGCSPDEAADTIESWGQPVPSGDVDHADVADAADHADVVEHADVADQAGAPPRTST